MATFPKFHSLKGDPQEKSTKNTKPRSFDDIVADQDLRLPGLEYFFGRERGIQELADYAKPCFENLLMQWRKQAVNAINRATSDIQDEYNKALKDSRKEITEATTGAFLKALTYVHDDNPSKVRGLQFGILICDRDSGMLLHVLPTQTALFAKQNNEYFPTNSSFGKTSAKDVGHAFAGSYEYKAARMKGKLSKASQCNKYND